MVGLELRSQVVSEIAFHFFDHYWHVLYAWFPSDAQTAEPDSAGFCGDLTLGILGVCQHFIVQQFSKICIARQFWILFKI